MSLTVQLKVHFKPVWEESIESLTVLSERFSASFWALVWGQIGLVLNGSPSIRLTPPTQFNGVSTRSGIETVISKFSNESQLLCTNLNMLEGFRVRDLKSERIKLINDVSTCQTGSTNIILDLVTNVVVVCRLKG